MKYRIIKVVAVLVFFSMLASCVRRTPWRRHRFNAHYRGQGKYWY